MKRPPDAMHISFARPDDLAAIIAIYNQAVHQRFQTADLTPQTIADKRAWFGGHTPDTHPIYIARRGDTLVGWCSLSPHRPGREALRATAEISCYIDTNHHRSGVARALFAHAMDDCARLGITSLFAILLDANTASIALFEALGFARWGHLPRIAEIDGVVCGQFIYGLHLREVEGPPKAST